MAKIFLVLFLTLLSVPLSECKNDGDDINREENGQLKVSQKPSTQASPYLDTPGPLSSPNIFPNPLSANLQPGSSPLFSTISSPGSESPAESTTLNIQPGAELDSSPAPLATPDIFTNPFSSNPQPSSSPLFNSITLPGSESATDCVHLTVTVHTDDYPWEMSWSIVDTPYGPFYYEDPNVDYVENICLPAGKYTLAVTDELGDGWSYENGEVGHLTVQHGEKTLLFVKGDSFTYSSMFDFTVSIPSQNTLPKPDEPTPPTTLDAQLSTGPDSSPAPLATPDIFPNPFSSNSQPSSGPLFSTITSPGSESPTDCVPLIVTVHTDAFPLEMAWSVPFTSPSVGHVFGDYKNHNAEYVESICLPAGQHALRVYDGFGDGWSHNGLVGYLSVRHGDQTLLFVNGNTFTLRASLTFTVSISSPSIPNPRPSTSPQCLDGSCLSSSNSPEPSP